MGCNRPRQVYQRPGGGPIAFSLGKAGAVLPATIACGQCMGCRIEHAREWTVRIVHEAQMHDQTCFLTLTYSDEHLPADGGLDVTHWQNFAKRARKRFGQFRFFMCAEYGELTMRPHYHAAIFGQDWTETRKLHKESKSKRGSVSSLYVDEALTDSWGLGHVYIGDLTPQSAGYVAGYITKKLRGRKADEIYQGRRPPFTTMSRNKGLGTSWFEKYSTDVYPRDEVIINGRRQQPPKFYDRLLALQDPDMLEQLEKRRKKFALRNGPITQERGETIDRVKENASNAIREPEC